MIAARFLLAMSIGHVPVMRVSRDVYRVGDVDLHTRGCTESANGLNASLRKSVGTNGPIVEIVFRDASGEIEDTCEIGR
jgi:hypothetical protein